MDDALPQFGYNAALIKDQSAKFSTKVDSSRCLIIPCFPHVMVLVMQLRDGSTHSGTVTSMAANDDTFSLHSELSKVREDLSLTPYKQLPSALHSSSVSEPHFQNNCITFRIHLTEAALVDRDARLDVNPAK